MAASKTWTRRLDPDHRPGHWKNWTQKNLVVVVISWWSLVVKLLHEKNSNMHLTNDTEECCQCEEDHFQTLVVIFKNSSKQKIQYSDFSYGSKKHNKMLLSLQQWSYLCFWFLLKIGLNIEIEKVCINQDDFYIRKNFETLILKLLSSHIHLDNPDYDVILPTNNAAQSTITCSKLTIETLEQGVKYVQK